MLKTIAELPAWLAELDAADRLTQRVDVIRLTTERFLLKEAVRALLAERESTIPQLVRDAFAEGFAEPETGYISEASVDFWWEFSNAKAALDRLRAP